MSAASSSKILLDYEIVKARLNKAARELFTDFMNVSGYGQAGAYSWAKLEWSIDDGMVVFTYSKWNSIDQMEQRIPAFMLDLQGRRRISAMIRFCGGSLDHEIQVQNAKDQRKIAEYKRAITVAENRIDRRSKVEGGIGLDDIDEAVRSLCVPEAFFRMRSDCGSRAMSMYADDIVCPRDPNEPWGISLRVKNRTIAWQLEPKDINGMLDTYFTALGAADRDGYLAYVGKLKERARVAADKIRSAKAAFKAEELYLRGSRHYAELLEEVWQVRAERVLIRDFARRQHETRRALHAC